MWTFILRETNKNEEKSFKFVDGHFVDEKSVRDFANGTLLNMVMIKDEQSEPLYIEPTATLQLMIFDGEKFIFENMYKRLFQNFGNAQSLLGTLDKVAFDSKQEQAILMASIIFISSALDAYLNDMIEVFCLNRAKSITNGAKKVFKNNYERSLKRFNNPSSKNLKEVLKELNLFPEVIDSIEYTQIDKLVIDRNKIAHGGSFDNDFTKKEVSDYLIKATEFMEQISSKIYKKLSFEGELQSWPTAYSQNAKIDKFWSLLPLLNAN
jgi:hypothetical protein